MNILNSRTIMPGVSCCTVEREKVGPKEVSAIFIPIKTRHEGLHVNKCIPNVINYLFERKATFHNVTVRTLTYVISFYDVSESRKGGKSIEVS